MRRRMSATPDHFVPCCGSAPALLGITVSRRSRTSRRAAAVEVDRLSAATRIEHRADDLVHRTTLPPVQPTRLGWWRVRRCEFGRQAGGRSQLGDRDTEYFGEG